MKFHLAQLHKTNKSKPIVEVVGIDGELQWDYCDLEGLPDEIVPDTKTMTHMGKIPKGQYDNLPKTFYATNGGEYIVNNIHTLKPNKF